MEFDLLYDPEECWGLIGYESGDTGMGNEETWFPLTRQFPMGKPLHELKQERERMQ